MEKPARAQAQRHKTDRNLMPARKIASVMYSSVSVAREPRHSSRDDQPASSTIPYRVAGDAEIETGLGRLNTVHLIKVREPGDTVTEVWLSPQHHMFPVKILIVERDGMRFEQVINGLELRD